MMQKLRNPIVIGTGISLVAGLFVFLAGLFFTNPSYAFYAGLSISLSGLLLMPVALERGK
jgi:hypothetical protein